jgi:hypothetical protein
MQERHARDERRGMGDAGKILRLLHGTGGEQAKPVCRQAITSE